jgi:glycosyltransferase involved in cell wall biosynthesis
LRILAADTDLRAVAGRQRSFAEVTLGLSERGHSVDVFFRSGPLGETLAENCRLVRVPGFLEPRSITDAEGVRFASTVLTSLRRPYDLIFVNRPELSAFAVVAGSLKRVPSFCWLHDHRYGYSRRSRWVLDRVTQLVAVSEFLREHYVRNLGMEPDKVHVIYPGLDTSHFKPADAGTRASARQHLGLPQEAFVIVYAGRIDRTKGIDTLLHAFKTLTASGKQSHLVIAGSPTISTQTGQPTLDSLTYLRELERIAHSDHCSWVGHLLDVRPLYHAADVAVVPSRWGEPFGRAVIEPMSCGIPVLASADGGIPEALGPLFSRFLFDVDDRSALREKLLQLRSWREREPRLAQACRDHVKSNFPQSRQLDSLEQLFAASVRTSR